MTIRRRLALSFLAILLLFGLNMMVYFGGNRKRETTVVDLQRAISRQGLIASIHKNLSDFQKEVTLLSSMSPREASPTAPEDIARVENRLDEIGRNVAELNRLAEDDSKALVTLFEKEYRKLSESWRVFYQNFGKEHTRALTELAVRGEPTGHRVMQELLPQLQERESQEVKAAGENFYRVANLTDQIAVLIFAVSTIVAFVVAFRLSRYLAGGLSKLKEGAAAIGGGKLDYRVDITSSDEIGDLATAFNNMSFELLLARMKLTEANREMEGRNAELQKQKQVSESLLLNILPAQIAAELEAKGMVEPKYFEDVTILFTDFVGFTLSTENLAAEELVYILHDYFTAFDEIAARYRLEKLKTSGDSYMCAGGLPVRNPTHPVDAVLAAFEMVQAVRSFERRDPPVCWRVRVGIHTGPVVAGVVGIQKFAFDIWGETVNYASRMESSGGPNRINLSERTYARVKDFFECEYRGKVMTKDKRELDMYFVKGITPKLVDGAAVPPPAFLRRYRGYFQSDPPAFPSFLVEAEEVNPQGSEVTEQGARTDEVGRTGFVRRGRSGNRLGPEFRNQNS